MEQLHLDLSGIGIQLSGLTPNLAERVRLAWGPFVGDSGSDPFLRVQLELEQGKLAATPFRPKQMQSTFGRSAARFEMPEGRAEVDEHGSGSVRLVADQGPRSYYALANLLRACLAWLLPRRGGALLHAAGLVVDGRAFLLVGPEGSGKSTWARLGQERGAQVLSDDIVPLDLGETGFEAVGAPFRSTYTGPYLQGRWAVQAVFFPSHGQPSSVRECSVMLARARITANLPFIADALERDPPVAAVVEKLASGLPCMDMTFGLDGSFVELLRAPKALE